MARDWTQHEFGITDDTPVNTVVLEKDVWNSTLRRSMVLQAENEKLKDLLKEWVQFEIEENPLDFTVMSERMSGLANKTKRILK